ncbi:MAG: hypothetical protein J6S67_17675 [Methanobrevibacter sp.]|nr:hypothetical protein [Methanobrevibacter sp.]
MEIDNYNLWVSLSTRKWDRKPSRDEVGKLVFNRVLTDVYGFADAIADGYCYAPIFKDATLTMKNKTDDNFCYSSFISIDIDHSSINMTDMLKQLEYKPTIAYTTCSNTDTDCGYRLVYCFEDRIESNEEYYNYTLSIINSNNIQRYDTRSLKASQYYNGNGIGNVELVINNNIYNKKDFIKYYKDYYNINNNKSVNENHILSTPYNMNLNDTFENKQFEEDYWNMRIEDILSKYVYIYPNLEHTPLPTVDADTPYIMFPSDYVEIRRYWTKKVEGRAIKLKDGMGRRHKLFMNGIIRRKINNNISFDNLLYNLLYELYNYISNYNAENIIGKKELYDIAIGVMKEDISKYNFNNKRKFIVNREYCIKYSMTANQVKNIAAKQLRSNNIGELYNLTKTDKENIEIMKANGLEVSLSTLKRWRKENGITKYQKCQ